MRHLHVGNDPKGWLAGPWDGSAPIAIGYANDAIDEPHRHTTTTEIFLVLAGSAVARVEQGDVLVRQGDVLILEPGEAHTFRDASPDYRAFVLHVGPEGDRREDVPPERLGTASGA